MKFVDLDISDEVKKAITEIGFNDMFPIQEQAIPPMMRGKNVIGQAKTGTGKTAAFGVPIIEKLNADKPFVQALVLAPTRELAQQITDDLNLYARYTSIWAIAIYGGVGYNPQFNDLRKNPPIVVGTPGRIIDHIKRGTLDIRQVEIVILDEADRMFDMGFYDDIEWIMKKTPKNRQVSLWSATIDDRTKRLSEKYMPDTVFVNVSRDEIGLNTIRQYYMVMAPHIREENLERIIEHFNINRAMIFCRTKRMVDRLTSGLKRKEFSAEALHGDFSQARRQAVLDRFKNEDFSLLITTEVAARGLDIEEVPFIINYDIPDDPHMYFHRIGRTARAGKRGTAITFVLPDQEEELLRIKALTQIEIEKFSLPPSFLF